jgi:hypothetical protein
VICYTYALICSLILAFFLDFTTVEGAATTLSWNVRHQSLADVMLCNRRTEMAWINCTYTMNLPRKLLYLGLKTFFTTWEIIFPSSWRAVSQPGAVSANGGQCESETQIVYEVLMCRGVMIICAGWLKLHIMSHLILYFKAFETAGLTWNFVANIVPDLKDPFILLKVHSSEWWWLNSHMCDIFSNIPSLCKSRTSQFFKTLLQGQYFIRQVTHSSPR